MSVLHSLVCTFHIVLLVITHIILSRYSVQYLCMLYLDHFGIYSILLSVYIAVPLGTSVVLVYWLLMKRVPVYRPLRYFVICLLTI